MLFRKLLLSVSFILFTVANVSAQNEPLNLVAAFPNLTFNQPLYLTHAGDSTDRIFVLEKTGVVHVFSNDPSVTTTGTFLDITDRIHPPGHPDVGETGLLSLAFHPNFTQNQTFYVSYVDNNLISKISEMQISDDPDVADLTTERVLLELQQPQRNHNGGHIAFGPDNYLYIAFGDGFSESSRDGIEHGDPLGHGQNPATWFSSVLRIDVDRQQDSLAYGIPPDNPFVDNTMGWQPETYAYGFRNPWRFSFDRVSGNLWLADVGDKKAEEIDIVEPGKNYGWNLKEATHCFEDIPCDTTQWVNLTDPIFQYLRDQGESITGGYVYRGDAQSQLQGKYIYGDFDFRNVWALDYDQLGARSNELIAKSRGPISSFGEDESGELYIVDYDGDIWRFEETSATAIATTTTVPERYELLPNYPNPFNPETRIAFDMPETGLVSIHVYDVLGRIVTRLTNRIYEPGRHTIAWDGRDDHGNLVAGGLYLYTLESDDIWLSRTMVLLK